MNEQTVTVVLVPDSTLQQDHVDAELLLFGALLAAGVTVLIVKWLYNYLMAGGRDD